MKKFLQERETRTREAIRQASDRVRAEIATMRTSADLDQITPLIWRGLREAKVSCTRCGVFIVDEASGYLNIYLASPEGESLAAQRLKLGSHPMIDRVVENWHAQNVYMEQWDRQAFLDWMRVLKEQNQPVPRAVRKLYLDVKALYFHVVPFAQGMLYIGNTLPLADRDIRFVQEMAQAFTVAYARYQDFKQLETQNRALEEANRTIRETMEHLHETQKQLIASMERELQTAHDVQMRLLPQQLPAIDGFDMAARLIPANHVGGDHYTFQWLDTQHNLLAIVLADVSGKEMQGAMTVMRFAEALHYELQDQQSPGAILTRLNRSLCGRLDPGMFITACVGVLDVVKRRLTLSNAGHPPVYYWSKQRGRPGEIGTYAFPLGIEIVNYTDTHLSLMSGDTLVFYTDGICEARNDRELYGFDRLQTAVENAGPFPEAEAILNHILFNVEDFIDYRPHEDDMTLMVIKVDDREKTAPYAY